MHLRDALAQIEAISDHLAHTRVFRGYRSVPVACSGVLALAAAVAQSRLAPDPTQNLSAYLALWCTVATVSLAGIAGEMIWRYARCPSLLERQRIRRAGAQFAPCVVAGGVLTATLAIHAPTAAWMLPGLWAMLFSLGIFASLAMLPPAALLPAIAYLLGGVACLAFGQGPHALSPWTMGLTFGLGQLLVAAVLYGTLERRHAD